MVVANLGLSNLVALVDHNDWGGMDRMSVVHPRLHSLEEKFEAFGWWGTVVGGHNHADLVEETLPMMTRPRAVICCTTKGKGISFMEDSAIWHYRSPSPEEYVLAMEELS